MRVCQIVVAGLLGLALAGCHNDPSIALLERDNFKKEQEIYRLRGRIEDLEDALNAAAPAQPRVLRGAPPGEMPPEPGTPEAARTRPAPAYVSPGRTIPGPELPGPGGLDISPGTEVKPGEIPERLRVPGDPEYRMPRSTPQPISPPGGEPSGRSSQWSPASKSPRSGNSAHIDNSSVAQITLHPALTGGIGAGRRSGDEGLLVVVEPRDFSGNIVNAPGEISVALLDPALSGEQARLGRWDFAAAQTQSMLRTGSQPGIHLRVPWALTPAHDRLKVFVRYTTSDGRKLQAERLVSVALDGPPVGPREARPLDEAAETASRPQRPQWSPVR
jgi:hypothetical protein